MNPASLFQRVLQNAKGKQQQQQAHQQQLQQQQLYAQQQQANAAAHSSATSSSPSPDLLSQEYLPFPPFFYDLLSPNAPASSREEQLLKLFTQLRHTSAQTQIQVLEQLSQIVTEQPAVILGCNNLLSLILRILQSASTKSDAEVSDASVTIFCKLFWIMSNVAGEHMNVKDLKRMFRILRRVVEKKSPPLLCRLMISSLADMATSTASTEMYISSATMNARNPSSSSSPSSLPLPLPLPPSCSFDFSGTQSALALPPFEKFTATKGYTVCMWIRWEKEKNKEGDSAASSSSSAASSSAANAARMPIAQPIQHRANSMASPVAHLQQPPPLNYLYSFLTDKARGIEGLIGKYAGNIVIRSCSRGVLQELNTEVKLQEKKWYLLSICHKKPQTFSRSSGTVTVYLNEEQRYEGELSFPQLPDPLIFNAFAAATHPSKPSAPFRGRMSTISFHTKALTSQQIQLMYRGGADLCIRVLNQIERSGKFLNFVSNSISTLLGALSSAATAVTQTAQAANHSQSARDDADYDSSSLRDSSSSEAGPSKKAMQQEKEGHRDIFRYLLCLYHPQCVEGHLALDCSPQSSSSSSSSSPSNGLHQSAHASILPGVQLCSHKDIRDIIHLAIGGITCFFPLFQHLDVLSGGSASSGPGAGAGKKSGNQRSGSIIGSEATSSSSSSSQQQQQQQQQQQPSRVRSQSSLLPLLLRTLQLMLRDNAANQIQFLQTSGFQMIAYLLHRYAAVSHLSESLVVALEELVREFSWGVSLAKLLALQADEHHVISPADFSTAAGASSLQMPLNNSTRKSDLPTNHNLPVARAGEKTLYNDFFLHILFNFGLWFRSPNLAASAAAAAAAVTQQHEPTSSPGQSSSSYASSSASSALDELSAHQVPFVVQFEILLLIKNHVAKNPRYFRRLLSAGGGSGVVLNAQISGLGINSLPTVHASGASIGPVKFILDSLRRFVNYSGTFEQYAIASSLLLAPESRKQHFFHPFLSAELIAAIRNIRTLRKEWLGILQTLMLCPNASPSGSGQEFSPNPNAAMFVRDADITALLQLICEVSEASASSIATAEAAAAAASVESAPASSPSQSPSSSSSSLNNVSQASAAYSWVLAEYVTFLTGLLRLRPDDIYPIIVRNGGCLLFVSMLARNIKYQHVQVSILRLINVMLITAINDRNLYGTEQLSLQLAQVFSALQMALSETYLTVPTYSVLMEIACGLRAGSLGVADVAEEAVERFCTYTNTKKQDEDGGNSGPSSSPDVNFRAFLSPSSSSGSSDVSMPNSSSPPAASASPPTPSSSPASALRTCGISFPRCFDLIHSLISNNDVLRAKDRARMEEKWKAEAVRIVKKQAAKQRESMLQRASGLLAYGSHENNATQSSPNLAVTAARSSDNIHFESESDAFFSPASSSRSTSSSHANRLFHRAGASHAPFSSFHPTYAPQLTAPFSLLAAPLVPLSHFLNDLDTLLASSPANCQTILSKWPMGIKLCCKMLDWRGHALQLQQQQQQQTTATSIASTQPQTNAPTPSVDDANPMDSTANSNASELIHQTSEHGPWDEQDIASRLQAMPNRPSVLLGLDIDSLLQPTEQQIHHASIEEAINTSMESNGNNEANNRESAQPATILAAQEEYFKVLMQQQLLADVDLAQASSSAALSLPNHLLASRLIEYLLFHAIVHIKDGWMFVRDAVLLLRLEAEQQQQQQELNLEEEKRTTGGENRAASPTSVGVRASPAPSTTTDRFVVSEEVLRSVRRQLLIALFQRLEQITPPPLSTSANAPMPAASVLLHHNLSHVIDVLEEVLYFDVKTLRQIKFRMVEEDASDSSSSGANDVSSSSSVVRKNSRIASFTRPSSADAWVLMDEDESESDSSSSNRDSLSSVASVSASTSSSPSGMQSHPAYSRAEWPLIRELLQCIMNLRLSLQPMRFSAHGPHLSGGSSGVNNESLSSAIELGSTSPVPLHPSVLDPTGLATVATGIFHASHASSSVVPLRTGSPLRVVIRFLLDSCSAVCLSNEYHGKQASRGSISGTSPTSSSGASDSSLMQLQDIVSSLGALVHVELALTGTTNKQMEKSASREWKNRYVLNILWRLCQLMHILPAKSTTPASPASSSSSASSSSLSSSSSSSAEQMRQILHSTVNQMVESLKPFAAVSAAHFDAQQQQQQQQPVSPTALPSDRMLYVPLVVNEEGFLDVDPSYQVASVVKASPAARTQSLSSAGSSTSAPSTPTLASGRQSPSNAAAAAPDGSSSVSSISISASPLYPRIMRCCNEYVAASVQLFHSMELQFKEDYLPESEKMERSMRKKLRESGSGGGGELGHSTAMVPRELTRSAWRSVQTYSYSEANRRAVADTYFSDHLLRIGTQWRALAHELYAEGSAWCSSDIVHRRKFYKIDPVEDGYRMRRKIKLFIDAPDHHQASQA